MLFNSFAFLIFFSVVVGAYFILPYRFRWMWLLGASSFFYMFFKPAYILILAATIVIDYVAGLYIDRYRENRRIRKWWLYASLAANVGVLAIFKYYNFLNANLAETLHLFGWKDPLPVLEILLPIGLSFHTFQAMSYTIEVYHGRQRAERHFGLYALYVMFFPQLVAGPIERPQNLLPQFRRQHVFEYERTVTGLRLMLWGFFKKMVVADNLGSVVDNVYAYPTQQNAITYLIAVYFFAFQIYCDFSGYTDIARGAARVIGFELMENFNLPYLAKSVGDFWRRWHISLSTWFRDYVYIPMGGSRRGLKTQCASLLAVFFLSGLWHGANWTYVIWGLLNGIYLIVEVLVGSAKMKEPGVISNSGWWWKLAGWVITFNLLCITWVFFRAPDTFSAINQLRTIATGLPELFSGALGSRASYEGLQLQKVSVLPWLIVLITVFFTIDVIKEMRFIRNLFERWRLLRYSSYAAALFGICIFGYAKEVRFIYFQF
jgi:alginate O-acetyltransferase complex protein AlgI